MIEKRDKLRIVFFGTPQGVVPFLEQLYETEKLVGVVTQPPKIAGRGFQLKTPPVGVAAEELKLKYLHPEKLNDPKFLDELVGLKLDLCVVAAFGRKIPEECLDIPRKGFVNIHYSLLPKYRGPAPIQHALLKGEKITGVSIFFLNEKIDEGPIIAQESLEIGAEDDYISLERKLTCLAEGLLTKVLGMVRSPEIKPVIQQGDASRAPLIKKEDGRIKWDSNAYAVVAQVKAFVRWPKAFFFTGNGSCVRVLKASVLGPVEGLPGTVTGVEKDRGFVVKCRDIGLIIEKVHPQGKKEMSGCAYWQGGKLKIGDVLE